MGCERVDFGTAGIKFPILADERADRQFYSP
jgi:hypothetical protein